MCCVFEQDTLSGSTQEDSKLSYYEWKIVDWDVKHQMGQTNIKSHISAQKVLYTPQMRWIGDLLVVIRLKQLFISYIGQDGKNRI